MNVLLVLTPLRDFSFIVNMLNAKPSRIFCKALDACVEEGEEGRQEER
jgi:hypothetical protein